MNRPPEATDDRIGPGPGLEIVGRRSSLFTRVPLMFAEMLEVPYRLTPVPDMTSMDPSSYAGNPALKLPVLRTGEEVIFGTQNICRMIAGHSATENARTVWPEDVADILSRNAQELVWHGMNAQVQLVMGTIFGKLPDDNIFFVKARAGLQGSLAWLDRHCGDALARLPVQRDISMFEITLFCLVEHLAFRPGVPLPPYGNLLAFADRYKALPAARATAFQG